MLSRIVDLTKQAGVILGAIGILCTAYVAVGLPIPATEAAVNAKVSPIIGLLSSLQRTQITILGDLTTIQRQSLRSERLALEKAIETARPADKITFSLRLGQIQDEVNRLDRRDEQIAKTADLK